MVQQLDRSAKKVFVLGVYASAVHARWIGPDGKDAVKALAVASEPYIFWRGEGAAEIIGRSQVPTWVGTLVPADLQFNGPSGIALDDQILGPLTLDRSDAWLCDLVPHSFVNDQQQKAINRAYMPIAAKFGLPVPSIPPVPTRLTDDARRQEILDEIKESKAEILILLGDEPIRWFVRHFDSRWRRLSDFRLYGQLHDCQIDGRKMKLLPVAHPRQVARLGRSSRTWFETHQKWSSGEAVNVLR
jgi:hypothetical protein